MLIYVPKLTNRLGYTLNVVFHTILRTDFEITSLEQTFACYGGARLCYGPQCIDTDAVWIKSCKLLFQTTIEEQELNPFDDNGSRAFFPVYGRNPDFSFDIFAASFYLLSRYEEYLPHHTDIHGRFIATESLAAQQNFLQSPIVEEWAWKIAHKVEEKFPQTHFASPTFDMVNTIDIDAAYCYRNKGVMRSLFGFGRDLIQRHDFDEVKSRWQVLTHRTKDPFDTFDFIIDLKQKHPYTQLIFFALLADYGLYDKNISYHEEDFRLLLKHLGDYAKVGIHTSYASYDAPHLVEVEIGRLKDIVHRNIVRNRSHFLKLQLPRTYRTLVRNGIRHDYTMGYAEVPGFRASISTPFPFYDLERDAETQLLIHPFALMDATLKRYQHLSPEEGWQTIRSIMDHVAAVGGTFSSIWHNENLCERFGWQGWQEVYIKMHDYCDQLKHSPSTATTQTPTKL